MNKFRYLYIVFVVAATLLIYYINASQILLFIKTGYINAMPEVVTAEVLRTKITLDSILDILIISSIITWFAGLSRTVLTKFSPRLEIRAWLKLLLAYLPIILVQLLKWVAPKAY